MVQLSLERGSSVLTMLAVAATALALAALFYRRSYRWLLPRQWRTLFALRAVAIVLVVLLLFRPVLSFATNQLQRRTLLFLLDTSASMATADGASATTRFDLAQHRLGDWLGRLEKHFDVRVIAFADQAALLDRPADLATLRPTGAATSLSRAFSAAAGIVPARDVEAVILLSDGIHNAAGDPLPAARALGRVVHTIGVGNALRDSPSYRDVRIASLDVPDQMPLKDRARVTAQLRQTGLADRVVKAALEEDGRPVAQAVIVLRAEQEVAFQFTPTTKGRHTYTVQIPVLPDEKIAENNHRSTVAQVVDTRIRVLYVDGTLRAEYGALVQRFLSKDPDLEFCALVQTRPGVFVQRTNMEGLSIQGIPGDAATLAKFDVIVVGDLDRALWSQAQMDLLVQRVRAGAGLLMLGGYHGLGPGGYGGTPLEEILPALLGGRNVGQMKDSFLPVLTPEGRAHPIFANIGPFFPGQESPAKVAGLPALDGCVKLGSVKPSATVLAAGPAGPRINPVMAVQPVGKGRAAVFTADTTRKWQQVPRALGQESPFLRFWGQTIRWLANSTKPMKADASVEAATDKAYYPPDSSIAVQAIVRDRDGEGSDRAEVRAQVRGPGGLQDTVSLAPVPGSAGHYLGQMEPQRPGAYQILVEARLGDATLHAEAVTAEVGRPNLEFDRLDLDDVMLAKIATATGGRYLHISGADPWIDDLNRAQERRMVWMEQPLFWPALFWLLFVATLTTEWFLRKRFFLR